MAMPFISINKVFDNEDTACCECCELNYCDYEIWVNAGKRYVGNIDCCEQCYIKLFGSIKDFVKREEKRLSDKKPKSDDLS
jgi:hypothetical protein